MGLPLFITPVEPEVAARAADKTAAAPRSAIRRRPMSRSNPTLGRMASEARRRWMLEGVDAAGDHEIPSQDAETTASPRSSSSSPHLRTIAEERRTLEAERQRIRDLRDRLERQTRQDTNLLFDPVDSFSRPPPVPDSRDYPSYSRNEERRREIHPMDRLRQEREDFRRATRRHLAPTPPYRSSRDHTLPDYRFAQPDMGDFSASVPQPASLTPALSPAVEGQSDAVYDGLEQLRAMEGLASPGTENTPSDVRRRPRSSDRAGLALSERVRAFNRTSNDLDMNRSRRLLRQARLDGLGDRDRSLSPDNGAAWDTLLTSITPDPQPPSVGSSFASNSVVPAASASTSSGQSTASTSMTSLVSPGEGFTDSAGQPSQHQHGIDCISLYSDTSDDEDGVDEHREGVRFRGPRRRAWRSYAEVVTPRLDEGSTPDAEELGGLHRIISRLTENDDIPAAWWASAGLRNIRRESSS